MICGGISRLLFLLSVFCLLGFMIGWKVGFSDGSNSVKVEKTTFLNLTTGKTRVHIRVKKPKDREIFYFGGDLKETSISIDKDSGFKSHELYF